MSSNLQHNDERPPVLGTWPRLYCAVLLYLGLVITGLYLITRTFHY